MGKGIALLGLAEFKVPANDQKAVPNDCPNLVWKQKRVPKPENDRHDPTKRLHHLLHADERHLPCEKPIRKLRVAMWRARKACFSEPSAKLFPGGPVPQEELQSGFDLCRHFSRHTP